MEKEDTEVSPIIEKSVGGRNIYIYEVEIEYHIEKRMEHELHAAGTGQLPTPIHGAYIRQTDSNDVYAAVGVIFNKFEAFVQSQDCVIVQAFARRCDLKYRCHAF